MARFEPHAYSKRYGEQKTGVPETTVGYALRWLRTEGLIEQGPSLWNEPVPGEKAKATYTYGLTALGNLMLKRLREKERA